MKYDLDILESYRERGLVEKNGHPVLPLAIWNYSRECQFAGAWDEVTKSCRGLVLDEGGKVVAKSFDKFFNMEEHSPEEIPNEPFEVFEKLDGSLGILFNYGGEWILATKGSFASDQAAKGMQMLKKYDYERLDPGFTYLFEIIYGENRIVCEYEYEDVVLLGIIDNTDGSEVSIHHGEAFNPNRIRNMCYNLGFRFVQKYDGVKDYKELKSLISEDREGYVLRFKNGFRMKIKGEEYVRLHRILTMFSNIDIWECLKDGKDFGQFLERVPDEFDRWVRSTKEELESQYKTLEREYRLLCAALKGHSKTKKEFAELAKKHRHSALLFMMFDEKDYSNYIWNYIRPEYQKPFWKKD